MARPSPDAPSASSEQDRAFVTDALGGNQEAYQQLMQKYSEPIRRHVSRMVRDRAMVDDLVQESFIKAFTSLSSYSSDYAFSTWLYKIATNHTIDYLRKKKLSTFSIDQPPPGSDDARTYELPDTTYRPDRHVMADQRRELIQEAIDALPPKYHRVIVLRHQEELSYDEIATELDLPLGTVKAHIFRARALLYRHLREKREHI